MLDKLHNAFTGGEYAISIFINFQKAFDTVDHGILLYKLYQRSSICLAPWLFEKSNQLVSFHNIHSNYADISCGVPQEFVLGPHINDMACVSTAGHGPCILSEVGFQPQDFETQSWCADC